MADNPNIQPVDTSPLAEAESYSLEELFSRDPLDLTEDDLRKICTELRNRRGLWNAEEASSAANERRPNSRKVPKPKATKEEVEAALASLNIGSLELDL